MTGVEVFDTCSSVEVLSQSRVVFESSLSVAHSLLMCGFGKVTSKGAHHEFQVL